VKVWFLLPLAFSFATAQYYEPHRYYLGVSLGVGGSNWFMKPAVELFHRQSNLTLSPFYPYFSVGFRQRFGVIYRRRSLPHQRQPLLFAALSYHNRWLKKPANHLVIVTTGVHQDLDYLEYVYIELSGGIGLFHPASSRSWKAFPTGEIKLGYRWRGERSRKHWIRPRYRYKKKDWERNEILIERGSEPPKPKKGEKKKNRLR